MSVSLGSAGGMPRFGVCALRRKNVEADTRGALAFETSSKEKRCRATVQESSSRAEHSIVAEALPASIAEHAQREIGAAYSLALNHQTAERLHSLSS